MNAMIARHTLAVADGELLAAKLIGDIMGRLSRLPQVAIGNLFGDFQDVLETRALNLLLRGYLGITQLLVDAPALTPAAFSDEPLDKRIRGLRELLVSIHEIVDFVSEDLADEDPIFDRPLAERALQMAPRLVERIGTDLDLLVDERDARHERFTHRKSASPAQLDAFVSELEPLMDDPWVTHARDADLQFRGDADAEAASLRGRTQLPWHH